MLTPEIAKTIYANVCARIDQQYSGDDKASELVCSLQKRAAEAALMVIEEYEKLTDKSLANQ